MAIYTFQDDNYKTNSSLSPWNIFDDYVLLWNFFDDYASPWNIFDDYDSVRNHESERGKCTLACAFKRYPPSTDGNCISLSQITNQRKSGKSAQNARKREKYNARVGLDGALQRIRQKHRRAATRAISKMKDTVDYRILKLDEQQLAAQNIKKKRNEMAELESQQTIDLFARDPNNANFSAECKGSKKKSNSPSYTRESTSPGQI